MKPEICQLRGNNAREHFSYCAPAHLRILEGTLVIALKGTHS
jgi:hypothetical protein